jgi:hypothetical protein
LAKVRIVYDKKSLPEIAEEPKLKAFLMSIGKQVAAEAQSTASRAEKGPGGRISGYADAGFSVVWENRGRRPRVLIKSNASPQTALRVLFYTQKAWGTAHLRRALYKFTRRGA